MLTIATVIALLLGEGVVRLLKPGFPGFNIPQTVHRPAEGLGFEMSPNQQAYTYAETVTINSSGLRGPELSSSKGAHVIRIVCLGDSLTFGVGVDDAGVYPRQLEALLNDSLPDPWQAEVVNAGVQRYYTYQEIDQFQRNASTWQADIVVLGNYPNDFGHRPKGDFVREFENEREQTATGLRKRAPWLYLALKRSALVTLCKEMVLRRKRHMPTQMRLFHGAPNQDDGKLLQAMDLELARFQQLAAQHQASPFVVTIPARILVQQDFPASLYPQHIAQSCDKIKLPHATVVSQFRTSLSKKSDPYLPWDNHLSVTGNRIVAETIQPAVQRIQTQRAAEK